MSKSKVKPKTRSVSKVTVSKSTKVTTPKLEEEAVFKFHGEVDPSFNCVNCKGEGLVTKTNLSDGSTFEVVCDDCNGTGKVGNG